MTPSPSTAVPPLATLAVGLLLAGTAGCGADPATIVQRVRVDRAATAEECPGGGAVLDLWAEEDGDGVPDGDELTARVTSCSDGAVAGGLLVRSEYVPPGDDCECGGARVLAGYDDGDAVLDPGEVDDEHLDCASPPAAVTGVVYEAAGEDGFSNLYLVDVADGSIRHLTSANSPLVTLSRPVTQGDLVLYLRKPDGGEAREPFLHRISTGVDTRLRVAGEAGNLFDAGFGAGGKIWVHGSGLNGWAGEGIWSVDPATGAVTRLSGDGLVLVTEAAGEPSTPTIFAGRYDYPVGGDVMGLHVAGGSAPLLALPEGANQTWIHSIDASANGVLFAGTLDGGLENVWVLPLAGGAPTAITANDGSYTYGPVEWAGDRVAYVRSGGGSHRVFLHTLGGGTVEVTGAETTWVVDAIEGRDGFVAFVAGDAEHSYCQDVRLFDAGSGTADSITQTGDACENYVLE